MDKPDKKIDNEYYKAKEKRLELNAIYLYLEVSLFARWLTFPLLIQRHF